MKCRRSTHINVSKLGYNSHKYSFAFTVIELLVIIVVIGILTAITIVSYAGITAQANATALQSDLTNISNQLKIDQATNGAYPNTLAAANGGNGALSSPGITYQYTASNDASTQNFCLTASKGNQSYNINSDGLLTPGGKNVIKNSGTLKVGTGASGITSSLTTESYVQVVSASGNGNYFTAFITDYSGIENSFNEGDDVVISFEMKSPDHNIVPNFYFKPNMGYYPLQGTMGPNFSTIWLTTKWKKAGTLAFHLGFSSVVGTTIIKNVKLAAGTVPTCWTPAS